MMYIIFFLWYMKNFEYALNKKGRRKNSVAILGAMFGDEGKGRITDELTDYFLNKRRFKKVVVYRDNGGANAGHTVSYRGKKIGLHQIGSGVLHKRCYVVLGKGMVIHLSDLLEEICEIKEVFKFKDLPACLMIDEQAVLCTDLHRALESVFKSSSTKSLGSAAATGRGIAPAYADILYRFPLRVKDLYRRNWKKYFLEQYDRYSKWIGGLGLDMKDIKIQRYKGREYRVGNSDEYILDLERCKKLLKPYVYSMHDFLFKNWNSDVPFIFEKAQGVGLDYRWGLYPDVSASNCCLDGITYSTEGIIDSNDISARLGVIKSTYTSSVGKRILPTEMEKKFANVIRDKAHEYGTTTGRPRDIAYMDLVMLKYFCKMGGIEELVYTHMDIVVEESIKACTNYTLNEKKVEYRPDQEYIDNVRPIYKKFKSWNIEKLKKLNSNKNLTKEITKFLQYCSEFTNTTPVMITYGPDRHDTLFI